MLKRTALYDEHLKLNGRMVEFGGWEMPVQYTGVVDEHLGCRNSAGLFDVSHMGEFHVEGHKAEDFLNYLLSNDVKKVAVGQAQYTLMCNRQGGIVDDLVIYRKSTDHFLLVVNAANIDKDFSHVQSVLEQFDASQQRVQLTNESTQYSQIAIQGRNAQAILGQLTDLSLSEIKTYWFKEGNLLKKIPGIIARTGYTGEDGFELYIPWDTAPEVWQALLSAGQDVGIKPCGLGARDTLRLEMKYPLYGHELDENSNPLEAGLGWVTKLTKPDFVGKKAILEAKEKTTQRKLIGFSTEDRRIPRQGYRLFSKDGQKAVGIVTSGSQSPSLKQTIGIGFVESGYGSLGQGLKVEIRNQMIDIEVVETPFYRKSY